MNLRKRDEAVLAALLEHGAGLAKPTHMIYYMYLKSQENAERAAAVLHAQGFENIQVHRTPGRSFLKRLLGGAMYSCIAETTKIPSQTFVFATSEAMQKLAETLDGEYDGWEAAIVE